MLKQENRLKKRKDFAYIYRRGRSFASRRVAINYAKSRNMDELLVGFSVSKKIGNAVVRNRVKRKMREIVRQNLHSIPCGYRIIFNGRIAIAKSSYSEISDDILYLIRKLDQKNTQSIKP